MRDETGVTLGAFGAWGEVIDQAWRQGAENPVHIVSDGDQAIASGLPLVYGRPAPHQLRQFHLLREYRRNIGKAGWAEAKELLGTPDLEQAEALAARIVRLTQGRPDTGAARPWSRD